MKWSLGPLLAALLIGNSACATRKVDHPEFAALFRCGAEMLSVNPQDVRAPGLVSKLKAQVDAARPEAKNQADMDLLVLYSNAAESYRRSILRLKTETAEGPIRTLAGGSLSSADLWNRATVQLAAAQQRFVSGRGLRKVEPLYMDPPMRRFPPMRKWRKP